MSIQSRIQADRASLPPSMLRVADAILEDPERILQGTITDLATACATSETTVVRFCHRLGLSGFSKLRLTLAGEIASERVRRHEVGPTHGSDLPAASALHEIVGEIALTETLGIEETAAALDIPALRRAVEAISAAPLVLMHGIGASASGGSDFERKLHRLGRMARSIPDTHDALVSAALLGPGQVALGFSHSGTTTEVATFLTTSRGAGATTIAITGSGHGPVVEAADIVLRTTVRESTYRSGAMASRSAQLLIVDCLFVAVAQSGRDATVDALRTTFNALEEYKRR